MSETRNKMDDLQKAAMYDSLAQFYKYTNPNYYMHYYFKHLHYMNKAMYTRRTQPQLAKIRVLHTSYDSSNIDFYLNGKRVIRDLPFKNVSSDLALQPGKYHVDIYPAGNMTDSVLNKKITVEAGKSYTLTTIDTMKKMRLLMFENRPQVHPNEAKFRVIHLSAETPTLDIAVKNRDIIFPKLTYKQATDYLGLTPMTIDIEAREAGTKNVLLEIPKLQFRSSKSYTILLTGPTKEEPRLMFISMED